MRTTHDAKALIGVMILSLLASAFVAGATSIIAQETWSGLTDAGWKVDPLGSGAAGAYSGANGAGYRVTFSEAGANEEAIIYADSGASSGQFVGNLVAYGGRLSASFSLYSEEAAPSALALYFASGGSEWYHYFTPPSGAGWATYSGAIANESFWDPAGLGQVFSTDFANVTKVGVYIMNGNAPAQHYQLDNFTFAIPEPETVWMILAVVMSMAITFRGQLAKVVAGIKARMAA